MKQLIAFVILISSLGVTACGATPTPTPRPLPTLPVIKVSSRVVAEGRVVPVKSAALSFSVAGTVAQVSARIGERVNTGAVLARLDTKALELQLAQAEAHWAAAQARYAQLKRGPSAQDLAAAQQAVKSAEAAYESLLRPSPNELIALKIDVEKAKAQVDRAQAAYDRIGGDANPFAGMTTERAALQMAWLDYQKALALYNNRLNPSEAQIQQALAAIQTAKSNLAKLTPTAEDLAAAEAQVKAAQAVRDFAADALARAQLSAPFAGEIVALDLKVGEQVGVGVPVARIADTTAFQVETVDLTEINVVNIKEGDSATITIDALPELELTGKVATIRGYGENRQGDIVYTIVVKLDQQDPRLRWNMTAKVAVSK